MKQCLLIWVIEDGREAAIAHYRLQEAQQQLESLQAELEELGLQVEIQLKQGNP